MARDHARIEVGIWSDPDFRSLEAAAQRMYMLLLTQPRLSYCGSLDHLPTRWAMLAPDDDDLTVGQAVKRLEADRFVVVDRDTHELLIRSFVRHDGLLKSPNVTKAMLKDRAALLSTPLREVVDEELSRAYLKDSTMGGWKALKAADPDLHKRVTGKGSAKGSGRGSP